MVIARIAVPNGEPVFVVAGSNGRAWTQDNRARALTGQELGVVMHAGMIHHTRAATRRQPVVRCYAKQAL